MSDTIVNQIEERAKEVLASRPQAIPTASGALSWDYRGRAITLPASADSLEGERGLAAFEAMDSEPIVTSSEYMFGALSIAPGYQLGTAIEEPGKDAKAQEKADYALAEEMRLYMERAVKRLETPLVGVLDGCFRQGRSEGHKLFEKVRAVVKDDDGSSNIQTVALKPKPRSAYRFVVTRNMDVLGVVPGNGGLLSLVSSLTPEESAKFVPIEDLFVYTFDPKDGDPRGRGVKRKAYDAWYRKQLLKPQSLTNASLFGSGRISLEKPAPKEGTSLSTKVNVGGREWEEVDWLLTQAPTMGTGSVSILPNGWEMKVHAAVGNGDVFEKGFDRCDKEIRVAFLTVTRATDEAEHGSKADSKTAEGMLAILVNAERAHVCADVREQYFIPDLALKYGDELARRFAPYLLMSEANEESVIDLLQSLPQAYAAGVVTDEQKPYWDRKLKQPERDLDETEGSDEEDADDEEETQAFSGPTFKAGSTPPNRLFTRAVRKANKALDRISDKLKAELERIDADTTLSTDQKQEAREEAFDVWEDSAFNAVSDVHKRAAEAGIAQAGQKTGLSRSQKDRLAEILAEQSEFLADFRDKYEDSERTDAEAKAQLRMYAARTQGTANEMFVMGSPDDAEFDWVLGANEHCPDCPKLAAGSPYTKETLYTYPGACDTACLVNCTCRLVRKDGTESVRPKASTGRARSGDTGGSGAMPEGATLTPQLPVLSPGKYHLDLPAGTTLDQVRVAIQKLEREVLAVVEEDGTISYAPAIDRRSQVDTNPFKELMKDKTITHNHPLSGVLSYGDLQVAISRNVRRFEAVLANGKVLAWNRPVRGWPNEDAATAAYALGYKRAVNEARKKNRLPTTDELRSQVDRALKPFGLKIEVSRVQ